MAEKIKVALIGGGRTGTPLLKELFKYSYVEILGVADKNPNAQSIKLAEKKGIFTTTRPMDLLKQNPDIDILIEVTGDKKLKGRIKAHLVKTENKNTIILHDLVARLFISVCTGRKSLIKGLHPHDVGIGS